MRVHDIKRLAPFFSKYQYLSKVNGQKCAHFELYSPLRIKLSRLDIILHTCDDYFFYLSPVSKDINALYTSRQHFLRSSPNLLFHWYYSLELVAKQCSLYISLYHSTTQTLQKISLCSTNDNSDIFFLICAANVGIVIGPTTRVKLITVLLVAINALYVLLKATCRASAMNLGTSTPALSCKRFRIFRCKLGIKSTVVMS